MSIYQKTPCGVFRSALYTPGSVAPVCWGDDHLSGTEITLRPRVRRSNWYAGISIISNHPNPPCTTMSLPIPKGILGTPRRFTPRKGLVSVALVLQRLYELWTERRVLPAWHSVGARTFLPPLKEGAIIKRADNYYLRNTLFLQYFSSQG